MVFVSVTRLRIRSLRFLPGFGWHALRSRQQVRAAAGYRGGSLLADDARTFWTMTLWDDQASMRQFMTAGVHRAAMPHLLDWCDEASVVHWEQAEPAAPSWSEAGRRMRAEGRASKVRHPSPDHAGLAWTGPRSRTGSAMPPASHG